MRKVMYMARCIMAELLTILVGCMLGCIEGHRLGDDDGFTVLAHMQLLHKIIKMAYSNVIKHPLRACPLTNNIFPVV